MSTIDTQARIPSQAIPVTILTGFLGAGKTTLLNRILSGEHGLRAAVLVNDFGSINIDANLVVGIECDGDVISLANGCVCCSIRDDLLAAIHQVIERPERPEYIVLEASGVAEPSGIAITFTDAAVRDRIRLDSIMCVVDAERVFAEPEMRELKLRQIAHADLLILNKVDLVSRAEIARIKSWLGEHFHRYRLVEATRGDLPLEILISAGRFDLAQLDCNALHQHDACDCPHCDHQDHNHARIFSTWSYDTDRQLSLDALREVVRKLPASIYRCKGVIYSTECPGRRAVLQVVGKRVDISMHEEWGERAPRRTQIVAIGAAGSINTRFLEETFVSCISDGVEDTVNRDE